MERSKLFYIVSRFPFPLVKGDKLRAYHQIKELSSTCDVYLCALSDQKVTDSDVKALEPFCKEVIIFRLNWFSIITNLIKHLLFTGKPMQVGYFYNKKNVQKVKKEINRISPDHIFCQLIRTSEYVRNIKHIPKTLDYMDALSAGMERRIENASPLLKWLFRIESTRLKQYEHHIYKKFDFATVISASDRNLIFHYKNQDIVILPNGIDKSYFVPQQREKNFELLFTGNMSYPPNVQSAIYLVEKIMPLVWNDLPNCRLLISGANPVSKIKNLASSLVTIRPWIDDIRTSYAESLVFIAPMLIGSGMQNKLLEAMSMKMPCITSELANRALGAVSGEAILVGKNEKEYANFIHELIKNPARANDVAEKGHSFVTQSFDWSKSNQQLLNLIIEKNARIEK
jgi:sugar transferase (PEP-CTERM/EpsH1 system associated)